MSPPPCRRAGAYSSQEEKRGLRQVADSRQPTAVYVNPMRRLRLLGVLFIVSLVGEANESDMLSEREISMNWLTLDDGWLERVARAKPNLTDAAAIRRFAECGTVGHSRLTLVFEIENLAIESEVVFLIESELYGRVLYKGPFSRRIEVEGVPFCSFDSNRDLLGDQQYGDILSFSLFDLNERRRMAWTTDQGYPFYNGGINRVSLLPEYVEQFNGNYRVEKEWPGQ